MKNKKINTIIGKQIDITFLKSMESESFKEKVTKIKELKEELYKKKDLINVNLCPICHKMVNKNSIVFEVYGIKYIQCKYCLHSFVSEMPSEKTLNQFYSQSKNYHQIYTDKKTADFIINQIATPKAKWVINQFERVYGRKPKSFLDVGAGGGHFVKACRKLGFKADGLEMSINGRKFCKEHFGFELLNKDIIKDWDMFKNYEIVTFWGVIEHTPYPLKILRAASKIILDKEGFVVSEVPRWNSFSTVVQKLFSDSIVRHLNPMGHIHCFTDTSLSKAYEKSNLEIIATWYFGMDAYELITQVSRLIDKGESFERLKSCISELQKKIDMAKLSDEMVFIGKPL